ncbi:MAG TPA: hypothetical protein VID72_10355 [Ktedonobacterales bacterium]
MSDGQTRVLVLLLTLFGIETLFNPTFRGNLIAGASGKLPSQTMLAGFLGWSVGGVALVALAAPAPKAATWIVVIFIALALLTHPQLYASALGKATAAMQQLTTAPASASAQKK